MSKILIVSNRDFYKGPILGDYPYMADKGALSFFEHPYNVEKPIDYNAFIEAVKADAGENGVMFFIHGYANPWKKVVGSLVDAMSNFFRDDLQKSFKGTVVLFDWPSNDIKYTKAQELAEKTANLSFKNANIEVDFNTIINDIGNWLTQEKQLGLPSMVCHSMGNLVLQKGAGYLEKNSISQCLVNAAAIANDSFHKNVSSKTPCEHVSELCERVTAYYSSEDDALPAGQFIDPWTELGLDGPNYKTTMYDNFYAVDCSKVVIQPAKGDAPNVHTSYYYINQVLEDFIATLCGETDIPNRTPKPETRNGFIMQLVVGS